MAGNSASISRSTVGVPRSSSTKTSVPSSGGSRTSTTSSWNTKPTTSSPSVTTTVSSPYQLPSTGGSRSKILVSNPTKTTTGGSRSTVLTSNPTKTTISSYSKGYTTYDGFGSTRTGTYIQKIDTLTTGSSKVVEDMKAAAYYSPYSTGRATYSLGRTYYSPASSTNYYEEERQRRAKQEWNSIENDIADLNRNRSVVANTLDDFVINNRTIGSSTYPNNSRPHTDIYLPTKDSEYVDAIEQVKRDRDKAQNTADRINDYNKKYPDIARTITSSSGRTVTGKNSELALAQQREAGAKNTIKELETARQNVDKANASQRTVYTPPASRTTFGDVFTPTTPTKTNFWNDNEYLDKAKKEQEEREKKKAEEEKKQEKASFWDNNEYLDKSKKEQEEKKKAEEEKKQEKTSFWGSNEYLDKAKKEQEEKEQKKAEEEKKQEKTSFWGSNEYLDKAKKEQEEKEQKKAEEEEKAKEKDSFWKSNEYLDKAKKEQEEKELKLAEEEKKKEKTSFWDNNEYLDKSKKEQEEREKNEAEKKEKEDPKDPLEEIDTTRYKEAIKQGFKLFMSDKKHNMDELTESQLAKQYGYDTPDEMYEAMLAVIISESNKTPDEILAITSVLLNRSDLYENWGEDKGSTNPFDQLFAQKKDGTAEFEAVTKERTPGAGYGRYKDYMPSFNPDGQAGVDEMLKDTGYTYTELKQAFDDAYFGGLRNNLYSCYGSGWTDYNSIGDSWDRKEGNNAFFNQTENPVENETLKSESERLGFKTWQI